MIRFILTFVLFISLAAATVFYYMQADRLKQQNAVLTLQNLQLQAKLMSKRGSRKVAVRVGPPPFDAASDAKLHLDKAEAAIAKGNIGDAVDECKVVAGDLQMASNSTSTSVRDSVAALQAKLDSLEQQSGKLLHKLGV